MHDSFKGHWIKLFCHLSHPCWLLSWNVAYQAFNAMKANCIYQQSKHWRIEQKAYYNKSLELSEEIYKPHVCYCLHVNPTCQNDKGPRDKWGYLLLIWVVTLLGEKLPQLALCHDLCQGIIFVISDHISRTRDKLFTNAGLEINVCPLARD